VKNFFPMPDLFTSLVILTVSFAALILVCLWTKPEADEVLKSFYRNVPPWGFWGPIDEKCRLEDPSLEKNRDFGRDVFNILVGLIWQTSPVTTPIYLVIQHWREMWVSLAVCAVTSLILTPDKAHFPGFGASS